MKHSRLASYLGGLVIGMAVLSACAAPHRTKPIAAPTPAPQVTGPALYPNETPQLRALINRYADLYAVPRPLVHKVIQRESDYRPRARNGPYYGLMQILPATAQGMGYQGPPSGLLDAETNLKYAVKYLRGAWLVSDGNMDRAVMWYARGYYYEARNRCMLVATGLRTREVKKYCG